MHCQRETARYLLEDKAAAYVFTACKDNQPSLFRRLNAAGLPLLGDSANLSSASASLAAV